MGFAQGQVSKRRAMLGSTPVCVASHMCAPPLRQRRANYSPREDLAHNLYSSIKFYWNTATPRPNFLLSYNNRVE